MKGFGESNKSSDKLFLNKKNENYYLKKNLETADHFLKNGNIIQAENIYSELIRNGICSYKLLFSYALLSRNKLNLKLSKNLLNKSISLYPTKVDHYILFAEIMRLEKNFQKASEFLLIARKINPRSSNVFYNFSLLYRDLDEIENAINSINQAIKLDINNNLYKLLKADLLKDKNKFQESKLILNELYLKNSINDKKDILLMLSTVERLDSHFPESEKILLSLIQDYPNFSNAYLNLSDLYFEQKMIIKAKDILSKGIEINPNEPLLYANLGVVSRSLGNINESTLYHLRALSLDKNLIRSYENISEVDDFQDKPSEFKYLFEIDEKNLNEEERYRLAFAKANILHKRKKFSEAATFYKVANDGKNKLIPSNKIDLIKKSHQIKNNYFNKDFISDTNNNSDKEIVFIVGMPRSGSTLVENILSINNDVDDLGEIEFLKEAVFDFESSVNQMNPYHGYLNRVNKLIPSSKIVTDKNLFNYMLCPIINNFFKKSKVIYCFRNPMDNILSIYRTDFQGLPFSSYLPDITDLYIDHYNLMKIYSEEYSDLIYFCNYDELVTCPSEEIKKLINWLGWDWSEKYLAPHKNKRSVFTASSEQVRNPINTKSLSGWKKYRDLLKQAFSYISENEDLKRNI